MNFQSLSQFTDEQLKTELERRSPFFKIDTLKVDINKKTATFTFTAPSEMGAEFTFFKTDEGITYTISKADMSRLADWIEFKIKSLKPKPTTRDK